MSRRSGKGAVDSPTADAPSTPVEPASPKPVSTEPLDKTKMLFGSVPIPGFVTALATLAVQLAVLVFACWNAFRIRTYALTEYGMVIHEFDPWFNFRATQYLSKHGWHAFFHWFDYMSWYPLGRPVGTTIYPGLQITSVIIHRVLKYLGKGYRMSLNDICCTVPCWGGSCATFLLALITYEISGSRNAAVIAALIMGIIPAHMMRSVGGGYDNESIAMTAMLLTFYFWIRSIRNSSSWPFGVLSGLAYGYMVAAWGGYVFVLNMVALHAGACVVLDFLYNRYCPNLWKAYSLFFVIGTYIATCVPPVGLQPFKSLEQLLALLVFIFMLALHLSERKRTAAGVEVRSREAIKIRVQYFMGTIALLVAVAAVLAPTGFFGPLSSRVRGLFVQHTRTGNPLVDSVAEHQPANADAYWHYLHFAYYGWMFGMWVLIAKLVKDGPIRGMSFMVLYSMVAYYFSLKMARLIILAGPVASCMTATALGYMLDWSINQLWYSDEDVRVEKLAEQLKDTNGKPLLKTSDQSIKGAVIRIKAQYLGNRNGRMALAMIFIAGLLYGKQFQAFNAHSEQMAHSFANPQLMFKSRLNNGQVVMIDDYREAYFWLRDKTPEDSRVMAWWDYGYQITGIGNRTSIADGNTWNHEHIATLGKCLTSPVKEAHSLIRHLADYVLIWAGGGGDDLAKSPHMARIGNSVYRDICPNDPLCAHFGFHGPNHENPTPMMRKSLLYNLHAHKQKKGVKVDEKLFKEAYASKYGLVRIFKVMNVSQESKAWSADPANRICDAPGSWYCVGQYPPAEAIQKLIAKRNDFGQLEDFNAKKKRDDKYHQDYMRRMGAH